MEQIPTYNNFESNEYLLCETFKQFLENNLNKCEADEKSEVIENLQTIFTNIEDFVCEPDAHLVDFINKYLNNQFLDEIEVVTPYIQEMVLQFLVDQQNKLKISDNTIENTKSQENLIDTIEKALKDSGLKLSSELSLSEIKYLSQNSNERETFIKILRFVAEIKKIDKLKNKTLRNEHLLNKMNHERIKDEFKYTDRLTETRAIKKHGQKYLGDCVEFNLNDDGHRLIFRLFDITADVPVYDNTIYIQVLGDPDYSH